ncbi:MAG: sulfotransferase [Planctomycetaceae bacterium]
MSFPGRHLVRHVVGRPGWRAARCCFVPSTGRTGSRTLTSLLDLSPQVRAFHEPAPQLLAESRQAFSEIFKDPQQFARIFAAAKSTEIGIARLKGQLYAETSNRLTFFAPVIARLLPNSLFIHLHRHPVDVVRSGMRRGWYCNHPWDAHRIAPGPGDAAFAAWPGWDAFAKTCWYWSIINEFALDAQEQIAPERWLTVQFDEFMDVESEAWRRIFEFLDVPAPAHANVAEVFGRRENGQQEGDFPHLSEWNQRQKDTLLRIAGETMHKLGYSLENAAQCV